jgi:hypothetical protein
MKMDFENKILSNKKESNIEKIKKQDQEEEKQSLEKGFGAFNSIIQKDGFFEVILPGLVDKEKNITVGGLRCQFKNWEEVKDYYLKYMESRERIKTSPIFEIDLNNNENLAFSDFNRFNPVVAPRDNSRELPDSVKRYLLEQEAEQGNYTYQETIRSKNWDKELFSFIKDYLKTKEGLTLIQNLNIKNLDLLTPRQAIELTSEIVINLTKYNYSETNSGVKTDSDNSSTLDLLKLGLKNKEKNSWQGNGVCRNFASITKAVFESLKENQTNYNFLRDTYCLYNAGTKYRTEKENPNSLKINDSSHAWNTFITVDEKVSNTTVIDTTWAKRNLETKEIENLDYTIDRINHIASKIILDFKKTDPNVEDKLNSYLKYQEFVFENKREAELEAVGTSFVKTLINIEKVPIISRKIILSLTKTYGYSQMIENVDPLEIESLYKISQSNKSLPFDFILDKYLRSKQLSNYHAKKLIFKNDNLQKMVLQKLKRHPGFENFVNSSFDFRNRIKNL